MFDEMIPEIFFLSLDLMVYSNKHKSMIGMEFQRRGNW